MVQNNTDLGDLVDVIYLDFAKAFDKVSHRKLAQVLKAHGIRGKILQCIISRLTDRSKRVIYNRRSSGWKPVWSGVPQGSVLEYSRYKYLVNGVVLEASDKEKDVGVFIQEDLKPTKQCASAAAKANSILGQMARSFSYRNKTVWISLKKTYVRPHLEYCIQAWNPWRLKIKKSWKKYSYFHDFWTLRIYL